MIGRTLGHYRVLEKLGEGGMGEVYRAHDEVLSRDVAIKVLPEEFSADPERLARFEREAKVLAALNHSNVGAIYGLERDSGQHYLVLELIEGETLAQRIEKGPIPVAEAVPLAIQIAEGLEAAHQKGMIHRDLKPANIKITSDGEVKVLDFGLAKPTEAVLSQDFSESPTLTYSPTGVGVLLGTAAYMSPEQVRGKEVDQRTDIWAFGVVLWEMLTGKKLFQGDTVSDILASTLMREPDWEGLPQGLPAGVSRVLRRCLVQDPKERLHDIADARIELQEALGEPEQELSAVAVSRPWWRQALPWVAFPLALVAGWFLKPMPEPAPKPVVRSEIPLPEGERLTHTLRHGVAVSPDGSTLAFVSGIPSYSLWPERAQLFLRNLDGWQARPIPGTEMSGQPLFSPDGQWLVFQEVEPQRLRKVPVTGGEPETICECSATFGATWGPDDTIVFSDRDGALQRVSAIGGSPELLTRPPADSVGITYRLPHFLPAGNAVLFTSFPSDFATSASTLAVSIDTGEIKQLIDDGMDARYLVSGHLVFARHGQLMVARFDPARLEVLGPEVPVQVGVSQSLFFNHFLGNTGAAQFSVSDTGLLAFAEGSVKPEQKSRVVMVDQEGQRTELNLEPKQYSRVRASRDGRFLLLYVAYPPHGIWLFDSERGSLGRQTWERSGPVIWGPGTAEFTFRSWEPQREGLYLKQIGSGPGKEEGLLAGKGWWPSSWSPDGESLAVVRDDPEVGSGGTGDIWIVRRTGEAEPFLDSEFNEAQPEFSPNGRWLAYVSLESGRPEVYVRPYPGAGPSVQVSVAGGFSPSWSKEGDQIFYRGTFQDSGVGNFNSVTIREESGTLAIAKPKELFEGRYTLTSPVRSYDVAPDGTFLLIPLPTQEAQEALIEVLMPDRIQLVQNWFTELDEKVPR